MEGGAPLESITEGSAEIRGYLSQFENLRMPDRSRLILARLQKNVNVRLLANASTSQQLVSSLRISQLGTGPYAPIDYVLGCLSEASSIDISSLNNIDPSKLGYMKLHPCMAPALALSEKAMEHDPHRCGFIPLKSPKDLSPTLYDIFNGSLCGVGFLLMAADPLKVISTPVVSLPVMGDPETSDRVVGTLTLGSAGTPSSVAASSAPSNSAAALAPPADGPLFHRPTAHFILCICGPPPCDGSAESASTGCWLKLCPTSYPSLYQSPKYAPHHPFEEGWVRYDAATMRLFKVGPCDVPLKIFPALCSHANEAQSSLATFKADALAPGLQRSESAATDSGTAVGGGGGGGSRGALPPATASSSSSSSSSHTTKEGVFNAKLTDLYEEERRNRRWTCAPPGLWGEAATMAYRESVSALLEYKAAKLRRKAKKEEVTAALADGGAEARIAKERNLTIAVHEALMSSASKCCVAALLRSLCGASSASPIKFSCRWDKSVDKLHPVYNSVSPPTAGGGGALASSSSAAAAATVTTSAPAVASNSAAIASASDASLLVTSATSPSSSAPFAALFQATVLPPAAVGHIVIRDYPGGFVTEAFTGGRVCVPKSLALQQKKGPSDAAARYWIEVTGFPAAGSAASASASSSSSGFSTQSALYMRVVPQVASLQASASRFPQPQQISADALAEVGWPSTALNLVRSTAKVFDEWLKLSAYIDVFAGWQISNSPDEEPDMLEAATMARCDSAAASSSSFRGLSCSCDEEAGVAASGFSGGSVRILRSDVFTASRGGGKTTPDSFLASRFFPAPILDISPLLFSEPIKITNESVEKRSTTVTASLLPASIFTNGLSKGSLDEAISALALWKTTQQLRE